MTNAKPYNTEYVCGWPSAAPRVWARALGRAEDADIDFRARRPALVTEILDRCLRDGDGRSFGEEEIWRWSVPRRTQALLAVARACAISSVAALARCARAECGEQTELEFELESLACEMDAELCALEDAAHRVSLRIPTGEDQRRWQRSLPADAVQIPAWIGTRLVLEVDGVPPDAAWQLPEDWLPGVEAALAARDPITDLSVTLPCAHCGEAFDAEIDLEALLLARFAQLQQGLLSDVHGLASAYHWSEAQVLALPAWRRAWYLAASGAGG